MTAITLFDLDGVLTRGDTMASLVGRRLVQHPARLLKAVPLFLLTLAARPESDLKSSMNRRLVTLALRGLNDHQYAQLAAETGRNLAARPGFINHQMIGRCSEAATQGRAIVVTASERRLARAFLDAVGLHDAELLASNLGVHEQALTMATHNVGAAKVARLSDAGINVADATFYTDSATDIPLAAAAAKTYLVNPGTRSRQRLQAAVSGTETIRCR
ncbi:HAD family hydrolase [Arthrobacter sp. NPDC056691]|uniref:HAD family hydrolase n=1 Tax=Arthrobacter sp. NPDC056691 TaxID=3345913 RepID=UPI00366BE8A9